MKRLAIAALLPISVSCFAGDNWIELDWNKGKAITSYSGQMQTETGIKPIKMFWVALIAHNKAGKQSLFFHHTYKGASSCEPYNYPQRYVWNVNEQAVQMNLWCKKFRDTNNYYIEATAHSDEGKQFIYEQFKDQTNDSVFIDSNDSRGWSVHIKNEHFLEEWSNHGGDAL
ncbi:hypothetical protein FA893_18020 [Photobacterium damselae subsp. piscicida]|uniref:hypothetical protein n=1 Tax=Photobacterium damselae TaxID=38293 RepID=UPI00030CFFBE|nr:hypothetical protein [Photobacterium damselae]OLQ82804.1 hypothetical protein BEI67_06185 [Photobacterium damselae subsp. piscicida]TFZ54092.1 hypothetical protein E4T25_15440 [Photobacterium damselae subsp. piscicida]TJZ82503.1 hypothetical protein FA893_18020 [Photobacterium damselae subsp. piscicida]BBC42317.1 hypothetical protein PDPE_1-03158 [Photobacterium damselae subsp. piscicida]